MNQTSKVFINFKTKYHRLYYRKMRKEEMDIARERNSYRYLSYKLRDLIIESFSGLFKLWTTKLPL